MQRRLTKSRDKIVAGVLGGIADYFGWDKAWTRIGGALLMCCTGFGWILYIVGAMVMPERTRYDDTFEGDYRKP